MTSVGKISSEGQTTIPVEVRTVLAAKPGDLLEWEVTRDGRVEVRLLEGIDMGYLKAVDSTLSEWESKEDEEAYRDL